VGDIEARYRCGGACPAVQLDLNVHAIVDEHR